jgi:predicted glutamine amidotransferase
MCELFGISSRHPTGVRISLTEFARRGGGTGPHIDGWGIAFFHEGDVQLIREAEPSAASAHLRFLHDRHIPSTLVISHIRKATQGSVCLRNTQPFIRELGGQAHTFAHNGDLGAVRNRLSIDGCRFRSIGETDSEHAFCYLLNLLEPLWRQSEPPTLEQRLAVFSQFAAAMAEFGAANFLYSDGDYLFVHSHFRRQDNDEHCAPGLHILRRRRHEHDLSGNDLPAPHWATDFETEQEMVLLASAPLSDEDWQPLAEHTVLAIRQGRIVGRHQLAVQQQAAQQLAQHGINQSVENGRSKAVDSANAETSRPAKNNPQRSNLEIAQPEAVHGKELSLAN